MSPEPQEQESESHSWESAARDEESAEIVRQLERGLPRWEGGHDRGWMEYPSEVMIDIICLRKERNADRSLHQNSASKYAEILGLLKDYKTAM
jgi:hypothetical protein